MKPVAISAELGGPATVSVACCCVGGGPDRSLQWAAVLVVCRWGGRLVRVLSMGPLRPSVRRLAERSIGVHVLGVRSGSAEPSFADRLCVHG